MRARRASAASARSWARTRGIAHRYALSLDIDTLVLGVKNRQELAECVAAAEAGSLPAEMIARVDASVAQASGA